MSTIKFQDAIQVLKEVIEPLNLELSVSEPEYTVLIEAGDRSLGPCKLKIAQRLALIIRFKLDHAALKMS